MRTHGIVPPLLPRGAFTGVPTHFRGWCATAAQGGATGGYRWVGNRFGEELLELQPHELEEDEWFSLVDQLVKQGLDRESPDRKAIEEWLRRHFPLLLRRVPRKRLGAFIVGVIESYETGEMLDDFPFDFEPVTVDLSDPCNGEGCITKMLYRPFPRQVIYQCPRTACREASRRKVEAYASTNGLILVSLDDGTVAAVRDLSTLVPESAAGSNEGVRDYE